MNPLEIIAVEYSTVQGCYHVDTLEAMIRNNHEAVYRGINNGYLLIGLFNSYETAALFVELHRQLDPQCTVENVIKAINNNEPF